jgi:uncharacterized protein involved in exopolysaccharide biosynthesis
MAYIEYTTSYEADATIWTERTSQQFTPTSPQDPSLSTFLTPASEQAGVLMQLLQTRSFLREVVDRTSLRIPASASDERQFFDQFSKRFRVEVLGTNLFRLAYRARDPRTGPEVVLATLAQRQEHLAASRTAATEAATSFYRSELALAQGKAMDAQRALDSFDNSHHPPLSAPEDYQERQLRVIAEDAKARVTDLKDRIDRSGVMPGILQMADSLDFQVVDKPLNDAKPSGGTRPAAVLGGRAMFSGVLLAIALIVAGTLLAGRVDAETDSGLLIPATLFATIPEIARGKSGQSGELRTALAAVAFAPAPAERARQDR